MDEFLPFELGYARTDFWRHADERFWAEHDIDDGTLIVAERSRLVELLP